MRRFLLGLIVTLGVSSSALAIDPYVRRHATGGITAGAPCAGNAISTDEQTCSDYYCNGSTWVQCSTGTGPGTTCTGTFTSNRVIKASSTGTACSFVNSAISEDGTTVCVISEDFGVVNDKWVFWDSVCSAATVKDAGIRWDTAATPDEFDFDVDGTTRLNLRQIATGTNASVNFSAAKLSLSDATSFSSSPSSSVYRGLDITEQMIVAGSSGSGAIGGLGGELLDNDDFSNWNSATDAVKWWDNHTGSGEARNGTYFRSTPYSMDVYAMDASDGSLVESRDNSGSTYLTLNYNTPYTFSFYYSADTASNGKAVNWSVWEMTNPSDTAPAYSLRSTSGGVADTFTAGASICRTTVGTYPHYIMTGDGFGNWHQVSTTFQNTRVAGTGTFNALVVICNGGSSTSGGDVLIDDAAFLPPGGTLDFRTVALDNHSFTPKEVTSGDALTLSSYVGVYANPTYKPSTVTGSTVTTDAVTGVYGGLTYSSALNNGTSTVNKSYGVYGAWPTFGTSRYALYSAGPTGFDQDADSTGVTCIADSEADDRLFGDKDCDGTKDAGEEFLDEAAGAGASNSFVTIDTSSGTDPVADSTADTLVVTGTSPIVVTGDAAADSLTLSLTQNAGTDVTADLEEEGQINATVVTGNAADDQVLVGSAANALSYKTVTTCVGTGKAMTYDAATNTFGCNTIAVGVGGSGTINTIPKWTASTTLGDSALTENGDVNTSTNILPTSDLTLLLGDQSLPLRFLEIGVRDIKGDKVRIYTDSNFGAPTLRAVFNGGGAGNQNLTLSNLGAINFGDSGAVFNLGGGVTEGELRFLEPSGSGTSYAGFSSAALALNRTCVFQDAAAPIPDSCVGDGVDGGGAPTTATYITQTADAGLSAEQALSALTTGYMKVTTGTGVVSSQAVPIPVTDGGTGATALTNLIALTTHTTGNYAAGDAEAGAALTGDSATLFFSSGTIEAARLPADDDVPEVGDFTNLVGGTGIDNNSGTLDLDLTEVTPTAVFGAGSFTSLGFNAGATDPRINVASGVFGVDHDSDATDSLKVSTTTVTLDPDDSGTADYTFDATEMTSLLGAFKSSVAAAGPAWKFNTTNTITGNLFDFQNAATSRLKQTGAGAITQVDAETVTTANNAVAVTHTITASGAGSKPINLIKGVQATTLTSSTNNTIRFLRYEPTISGSTSSTNVLDAFSVASVLSGTLGDVGIFNANFDNLNATTGDVTPFKSFINFGDGTKGTVAAFQAQFFDANQTGAITTNLIAGVNIKAGNFTYGTTGPVVGFRQESQAGSSANIKGFAVSHDSTLLNGLGIGWTSALDTAFSSASTSWIGNTDGTSRTLKAEGAIIYDNCGAIASASSIAVNSCNTVTLTGSTTVNTITACNAANSGRMLVVMCGAFTGQICDEIVDGVTCGASGNLRLNGAANFVCTGDDTLSLVCDATNWLETGRGVN